MNHGTEAVDGELRLFGDDALIEILPIHLGPHEQVRRNYGNLSGVANQLRAELQVARPDQNRLAADDVAFALVPDRHRIRVLVVTAGNLYLDAALLLDTYFEVTTIAPADPIPEGPFEVAIFDSTSAPLDGPFGAAVLLAPPENPWVELGPMLEDNVAGHPLGFDRSDDASAIVKHCALSEINMVRSRALRPQPSDRVLGASDRGALLVQGKRGTRPFLALGLDIRESDLPLRNCWPLMLLSAIREFVREDARFVASRPTGSLWKVDIPSADGTRWRVEGPGGPAETMSKRGVLEIWGDRLGIARLSPSGTSPSEPPILVAGSLGDRAEMNLARPPRMSAPEPEPFAALRSYEHWFILAAVAAILAILEWGLFHRRISV